eukprot:CAMPEP_0185337878 /NCGR_PEP_ID=MMETSP1363-20130426/94006_1 /TAXON_ID=38817 /ORGANISM="Gephyrocapsa oceanica, Strain RCC1303" /LENGTH=102 /DNA_ID=CAMNT_0027937035 /DNA_START=392 /DNA_END=701 /DNA_ORIENTATION=+
MTDGLNSHTASGPHKVSDRHPFLHGLIAQANLDESDDPISNAHVISCFIACWRFPTCEDEAADGKARGHNEVRLNMGTARTAGHAGTDQHCVGLVHALDEGQ